MKKIFVEFPYGDTILKVKENVEKRLEKYKDLYEENYIFGKLLKKELDEIKDNKFPMDSFSFPIEGLKETEYVYLTVNFWNGEIEFEDEREVVKEEVEKKLPEIKEKFNKLRDELIEKLPSLAIQSINELDANLSKRKRQEEIRKEVEELLKYYPSEEIEKIDLVDSYEKLLKNNKEYFEKFFRLIPEELIKINEESYGVSMIRFYYRFDFTVKSDLSIEIYNKTKNNLLFNTVAEKDKWMEEFEKDNRNSWDTAWEDYKENAGY